MSYIFPSPLVYIFVPVGSIYINAAVTTNPATLLGFGTWAAFGTGRVIVGYNASDLIGEACLAIEMGSCSEDIALTIHPHPTLTETFSNTAEVMEKTITDLYIP